MELPPHLDYAQHLAKTMNLEYLQAPFPWFGGKSTVADLVWQRFGDVPNFVSGIETIEIDELEGNIQGLEQFKRLHKLPP